MEVPICIDLDRFVERSNGVFGKSGREIVSNPAAAIGYHPQTGGVNLILICTQSMAGKQRAKANFSTVKGLRQLFPGQVQIYTRSRLYQTAWCTRCPGTYLGYDQIEVEDIMLVRNELNLSEASLENALILRNEFGRSWITQLLTMGNEEIEAF